MIPNLISSNAPLIRSKPKKCNSNNEGNFVKLNLIKSRFKRKFVNNKSRKFSKRKRSNYYTLCGVHKEDEEEITSVNMPPEEEKIKGIEATEEAVRVARDEAASEENLVKLLGGTEWV